MKSIRNEIKNIMRAVTVLVTIVTMAFVLAGSANAVVIGPIGNPTVVHAPVGTVVSPFVARPAFNPFFRPAFNPFFRPAFNPFFRPAFNPFFRPPIFNPFFGDDLDDLGLGIGRVGIGEDD
jgi:hypothetical protein